MKYKESIEQAAEYTRLALPLLAKHQLPADPTNYAVTYEYVSGKNKNLVSAIDGLEKKGSTLTPEVSEELYRFYLEDDNDGPELGKMRDSLRRILSEILGQIVTASDETEQFRNILHKYSNTLVDSASPNAIRDIVNSVVDETKGMEQSNKCLEEKLKSNAQEMERLRIELTRAKEEALVDSLTQLSNRKAFSQKYEQSINLIRESGGQLSLLIIDIDHFKKINDTHGHLVGDEILRLVASAMKETVKGTDLVSRFGGDEFSILLPDTPLQGAVTVASNLIQLLGNKKLKRKSTGDSINKITLSIGATSYKADEPSEEFIKRADDALYFSKQNGRNRVTSDFPK